MLNPRHRRFWLAIDKELSLFKLHDLPAYRHAAIDLLDTFRAWNSKNDNIAGDRVASAGKDGSDERELLTVR